MRAHRGLYGPGPGPYEGETLQEKRICSSTFLLKIVVFDLHMTFFDSFNVFFRFLTEIRFRTIMKLTKKHILDPKSAVSVPPSPCLKVTV